MTVDEPQKDHMIRIQPTYAELVDLFMTTMHEAAIECGQTPPPRLSPEEEAKEFERIVAGFGIRGEGSHE